MNHKEREIEAFLAKKSKAAIVLEMLFYWEQVTAYDIINYYREQDPKCPVVFTTCPHKLVEKIRKQFGYDFVKDKDIQFFRTQYSSKGKQYRVSDTYKEYFLDKLVGG
jgi:hypothetical protein